MLYWSGMMLVEQLLESCVAQNIRKLTPPSVSYPKYLNVFYSQYSVYVPTAYRVQKQFP